MKVYAEGRMMHLNGLPVDLAQFVDEAWASGQYPSVDALVCEALQVLREQAHPHRAPTHPDEVPSDSPPQLPDDYPHALAHALRIGKFGCARQLATAGAARYPAHDELQKCARVLAPPIVRAMPVFAASRASVKANNAWMKAHWQDHRGQWVAVRDGQLLHATSSFDELIAHVGAPHGVLLTKIH
jgi:hypothetical protein